MDGRGGPSPVRELAARSSRRGRLLQEFLAEEPEQRLDHREHEGP